METIQLPDGTTLRLFEWKEKEWYKKRLRKITCECGTEICVGHKSSHINTQKHKQLMRSLEKNKITN